MSKLNYLNKNFNWPTSKQIFQPSGFGPRILSDLVQAKVESAINRKYKDTPSKVGILVNNPKENDSRAPIAIVCEFQKNISSEKVKEIHRLAWNFCHAPLLITIEPNLIRTWSLFEKPKTESEEPLKYLDQLKPKEKNLSPLTNTLHWVNLTSGKHFERYKNRFKSHERVDKTLLDNLKYIRQELIKQLGTENKNTEDIVHDLIARIIFIQFLFHRKDSTGTSALNAEKLKSLFDEKILSKTYIGLEEILKNKKDTYSLFGWLNQKFNGDLFPAKQTIDKEKKAVTKKCLDLLADFIEGKIQFSKHQYLLWSFYSFDIIPLEFISNIYQEFVSGKQGVHYTPGHLVDFILDQALPWEGREWDLKVLDPSCGSGIFLVKVFKRLVQRWKNNNETKVKAPFLRQLLEKNIFGVDTHANAVRVASFSLYLSFCDEIDPKNFWTQVKFPSLRGKTLLHADFFDENVKLIKTPEKTGSFDFIVGNAPWGKDPDLEHAQRWATKNSWEIVNEQVGTLFLAKSAKLCKSDGKVAMIQPAGSLLFNRRGPALNFRKKFFSNYRVEQVFNFSALRFKLFEKSIGPAASIVFRPSIPNDSPIFYCCPKMSHTDLDDISINFDSTDINWIYPEEASEDSYIWTSLAWGGRRDYALIKNLLTRPSISDLDEDAKLNFFNGFKRGNRRKVFEDSLNIPTLANHKIWNNLSLYPDLKEFPKNQDPNFEGPRKIENYSLPILIFEESWKAENKRYKAVFFEENPHSEKLLFSESFDGIRSLENNTPLLKSLTVALNSKLLVYFAMLYASRLGSFIPTLLLIELKKFPAPNIPNEEISLNNISKSDIDQKTKQLYSLKDSEWALVEDLFDYTLPDFKGNINSPGRQPAVLKNNYRFLKPYFKYFINSLKATFGAQKNICATIYTWDKEIELPFCLVGIHLDLPQKEKIKEKKLNDQELLNEINKWNMNLKKLGIGNKQVLRIYEMITYDGKKPTPTIFLIKPNQIRYWTRSMALRDSDEVAENILDWTI